MSEREAMVSALAYALARATRPQHNDTARDYAVMLAPLVEESGYLTATPPASEWEAAGFEVSPNGSVHVKSPASATVDAAWTVIGKYAPTGRDPEATLEWLRAKAAIRAESEATIRSLEERMAGYMLDATQARAESDARVAALRMAAENVVNEALDFDMAGPLRVAVIALDTALRAALDAAPEEER